MNVQREDTELSIRSVFLGGTCNNSLWRDQLIPLLAPHITFFNPYIPGVGTWIDEVHGAAERWHRANDSTVLYVLTPLMTSNLSVVEATQDAIQKPHTIICILPSDNGVQFDSLQMKHWRACCARWEEMGAQIARDLAHVAEILNAKAAI